MLHEPIQYLMSAQVTELTGRHAATIREWVHAGIFPQPTRIGRAKAWFWPAPVISGWITEHPELVKTK